MTSEPRTTKLHPPAIRIVETALLETFHAAAGEPVTEAAKAATILRSLIGHADREKFAVLNLDARNRVIHAQVTSTGTMTSSLVHPREVFKAAVLSNANAVIVGHNHPSGDVTPSDDDLRTIARLKEAGEILGIRVLDALIVGPTNDFHTDQAQLVMKISESTGQELDRKSLETLARGLSKDLKQVLEVMGGPGGRNASLLVVSTLSLLNEFLKTICRREVSLSYCKTIALHS